MGSNPTPSARSQPISLVSSPVAGRPPHELMRCVRHPETMKMAVVPAPSRPLRRRAWRPVGTNDPQIFEAVGHAPVGHPETMKMAVVPAPSGPLRRRAWRPVGTNDPQIFEAVKGRPRSSQAKKEIRLHSGKGRLLRALVPADSLDG